MGNEIRFWRTTDEYGCFSNFSRHPVVINGITWKTSEHFYQAQKFASLYLNHESDDYRAVMNAKTPGDAAAIGRDPNRKIRKDWELVKDNIMIWVLCEKVKQHQVIKEKLLSTGDAIIIEDSPTDYYWGCGKDNSGKNKLGILWMKIRENLKYGKINEL